MQLTSADFAELLIILSSNLCTQNFEGSQGNYLRSKILFNKQVQNLANSYQFSFIYFINTMMASVALNNDRNGSRQFSPMLLLLLIPGEGKIACIKDQF